MNIYDLKYKKFGECSILIEWPALIDENILKNILLFKSNIDKKYINLKIYVKTSYNSLLITYPYEINETNKFSELKTIYSKLKPLKKESYNKWEIPVCYDITFGKDLKFLKDSLSIEIEEIISLHVSKEYRVFHIGFLPGFLYLGGLDEKIHYPRKDKPELNIQKGSVGIGGSQTGIYPNNSPGGWNIIGKTPIKLFNIEKIPPCFINPGDKIKFKSISKKEYELISIEVESNIYELKKTLIND